MGLCGSSGAAGGPPTRLLIIGPGGTGKSTLFKQVKLKHGEGFSEEELRVGTSAVRTLLLDTLRVLTRNETVQNALGDDVDKVEEGTYLPTGPADSSSTCCPPPFSFCPPFTARQLRRRGHKSMETATTLQRRNTPERNLSNRG